MNGKYRLLESVSNQSVEVVAIVGISYIVTTGNIGPEVAQVAVPAIVTITGANRYVEMKNGRRNKMDND